MKNLIEIVEYNDCGYEGVIHYDTWRVAILNYIDELEVEHINNFQKHDITDEVFVLLSGRCILYLAETNNNSIFHIEGIDMEQNKIYNIKKGVYHTHTLSKDAKVLIVENDNTNDLNSPKMMINDEIRQILKEKQHELWRK